MPKALNRFFTLRYARRYAKRHIAATALHTLIFYTLVFPLITHAQEESTDEEPPQDSGNAATTEPTAPPIEIPNIAAKQQQLLTEALQDQNLITLTAEDEDFSAIWQTDTSGTPIGAALIFHGEGEHANWPLSVSVLREQLTRFGWATLSITLPNPTLPRPPDRPAEILPPEKADPSTLDTEQPDTAEGLPAENDAIASNETNLPPASTENTLEPPAPIAKDVEAIVQARIETAMAFLNSNGQYNIIYVGYGIGASRAARYIDAIDPAMSNGVLDQKLKQARTRALINRPIRALILINARNRIPYSPLTDDKFIIDWINDAGLPVLDVYNNHHYLDNYEPAERVKAARKKQLNSYTQIRILPATVNDDDTEDVIAKRVRGFLNKHAKGVRIDD
ncbi:DUF3530 family protein [Teredinibacter purpureus]|uniref:DUF3530 family protein n=1 Tax=Teredinibacter purpureus TaxID=2731756 RepID=UPI000ADB9018|nr:DUF3530 family protein [Teredinibacter purpureus]